MNWYVLLLGELCPKFEKSIISINFSAEIEFHKIDPRKRQTRAKMM
jgi:hypothetical protein